ncbi:hypothetical protein FRC17_003373 [Serendipita sp. 399]|nr:hypothetical protein FRC17_003373 [Serendipita sp. 399]
MAPMRSAIGYSTPLTTAGVHGHTHPDRVLDMANWNTTILVKSPSAPLLAQLRVPPPLTLEGKPVEPEVEKTFIQKYWMHLIGGFLLISLLAPAPEEGTEGGNSGANGGGGGGAVQRR